MSREWKTDSEVSSGPSFSPISLPLQSLVLSLHMFSPDTSLNLCWLPAVRMPEAAERGAASVERCFHSPLCTWNAASCSIALKSARCYLSGSLLASWDTLTKFSSVTQSLIFALSFAWVCFQTVLSHEFYWAVPCAISRASSCIVYPCQIDISKVLLLEMSFFFFIFILRTTKLFTALHSRAYPFFLSHVRCNVVVVAVLY